MEDRRLSWSVDGIAGAEEKRGVLVVWKERSDIRCSLSRTGEEAIYVQ